VTRPDRTVLSCGQLSFEICYGRNKEMRTWNISKTQYKVSDFISWQRSKALVLSPSFQRRPVWKPAAKSYLIDTIVRGLPIPIIFLRERQTSLTQLEPLREVVDGQQRIRTIISFISPALLPDYKSPRDEFQIVKTHNKDLAGKPFECLPKEVRQSILDYQFSVHVLPSEADDREILQIFARMNATGVKLNDQELRNAEFYGEFKTSVYEQATKQLSRWRDWRIFTEDNIARMQEVELVSEMYQLMIEGITGKSQKALDKLYKNNDEAFPFRNEVEMRFQATIEAIDHEFGMYLKDSVFRKKTLFYILFGVIYDALFGLNSSLSHRSAKRLGTELTNGLWNRAERIEKGSAPKAILDATTRRTTNPGERNLLFKYLKG
jgi:hypothetical protein